MNQVFTVIDKSGERVMSDRLTVYFEVDNMTDFTIVVPKSDIFKEDHSDAYGRVILKRYKYKFTVRVVYNRDGSYTIKPKLSQNFINDFGKIGADIALSKLRDRFLPLIHIY